MKKIFATYYNRKINERGQLYEREEDRQFNESLFDLRDHLAKYNIDFVLITSFNQYVGGGIFYGYWKLIDGFRFELVQEPIKPDLIFDKGHIDFNDGLINFFNNHDFARLGRNKYTQAIMAEDFVPVTQLVCSKDDYAAVLDKIKTEEIVAKPLGKNGGDGVVCYDRDKLSDNQDFPVIMQEFVESNDGIEGMVKGRHDIRLYIVDGEVAMCSIRQPVEGGWLSNTHKGGTIHFYPLEEINKELLSFAQPIIEKFNKLGGKWYSVDFMHGNGRWYMVEMNDRPGVPALFQDTNGAIKSFYEKLTAMIVRDIA